MAELVICAVRGHPYSRATVTRAIDSALARGARLTFVHTLDIEFLEHATIGPPRLVYQMLREMAEFMMILLCDRARRRGIKDVDYVFLQGNVHEQLSQYVIQAAADLLVMGVPEYKQGSTVFTPEELQAFVAEIERAANIRVVLVEPEDDPKP